MNTRLFSAVTLLCALTAMSCGRMSKPDAPGYSGKDITGEVEIRRDKQTKEAALHVAQPTDWEVYAGPSVEQIDLSLAISEGVNGSGDFTLAVPARTRSYFQIVTPKGNAIMAERRLPMEGGYNYRDMGGIRNKDGRYVKWGKVFRTDDMHNLTDADLDYLASIPVISVVDFRSTEEIESGPDKLPSSVTGHYLYSITPGNIMNITSWNDGTNVFELPKLMEEMNRTLVSDADAIEQYKRLFSLLQDEEKTPLTFHCSAGKDRTGMGAALFLAALGVDEQTIMNDYLASNIYLEDKYASITKQDPQLEALTEVRAEYLQAGLDQIKEHHGSIEKYLTETLGVNLDKMKEMYLY